MVFAFVDGVHDRKYRSQTRTACEKAEFCCTSGTSALELKVTLTEVFYESERTLHQNFVANFFGSKIAAHSATLWELFGRQVALDDKVN